MSTKAYLATLDDDEEACQDVISNYYFLDKFDEPVSFLELPIRWSNGESSYDNKNEIYLRGTIDNGFQRLHKQVKAWKYDSLNEKLEISVLLKDNVWIKLQKPRKSYENLIRSILITVHCLHFFKGKPEASGSSLWNYLCEIFSLYDVRPLEDDLIYHLYFIGEAVKRDETLQKSKFLASFLEGKRRKKKSFDQNDETIFKPSFIVDDVEDEAKDNKSESENKDDMCDNVCAICDEGGDLTCCDGKCFRSFHATMESAEAAGSKCTSLGLPAEIVKGSQPFVCLNCTHEQHQCFVCGELGSSNKSSGAEVFGCSFETCGHFYHPKCVAKLIQDESDTRTQVLEEKIADGESFICPVHKCHRCKQEENEKVKSLQFAICRRCPKSYHRKCLPRTIVFDSENDETVVARAWNNLLHKSRALIFCLKHEIDLELETPVRTIKFPEIGHAKKKVSVNEHYSDHTSDEIRVGKTSSSARLSNEIRVEKTSASARPSNEIRVEKTSSSAGPVDSSRKRFITLCAPGPLKKQRLSNTYEKSLKKFVPVRSSFGHSSTVMENWKNSNIVVAQQHGHISEVQEQLLSENVDAFDLPVENPEIISEKVASQTTEKAENPKSSKHIGIAQQQGHISTVQGPPLSDEHVKAFDLPVQNREILGGIATSQTTEKVINCKRSKDIDVAQQQGPVSKVHEPLLSEIVEAFDFPVENHEFLGEKDTSRKTEVENGESSKHTAIAQQHGHIIKVQGQPLSENVSAFNLPVENRLRVNEKDTTSQTTEEMETHVSKELSFVHLSDSPVENCKSNGEKHAGQTTKKRANRSSRKCRRRNKAIAIAQHCISNIQEPKIPGKSAHPFSSQVNNCDLNAEQNVSQTTTEARATCLIRSQKKSTRCDNSNSHNITTSHPYTSDEQPYNKSRRPDDGVHFHGYERENEYHDKCGYNTEAYNRYRDKPYNPPTAQQRYTPKLDEGNQNWNHNWMEKRGMFYDHHLRGCDPHMHAYYGFAPVPLPYGPHHNSSWGRINERMYY